MSRPSRTSVDYLAAEVRRGLWVGRRRWWTASFVLGGLLLAACALLLEWGPYWAATAVFVPTLPFLTVGVIGLEIEDFVEWRRARRDKRAARTVGRS